MNQKYAIPTQENYLIRLFGFGNLLLLPFLVYQIFYNYFLIGNLAPLSIENIYCAILHIANITYLAKKVLLDDEIPISKPEINVEFLATELQIIKLIRQGLPNKAIAPQLGISEFVVKNYIHQILKKTQTKNRVELICKLDLELNVSSNPSSGH